MPADAMPAPAAATPEAMVRQIVADVLGLDLAAVQPQASLDEALACDQLERLEIAIRLEDIFAVAIDDNDLYACATVADLVALLARLGAKADAQPGSMLPPEHV